jgi:nicotinamidase-related amidase
MARRLEKLRPEETAFIIMDVQNDFVSEKGKGAAMGMSKLIKETGLVDRIKAAKEGAKKAGMHIIYINTGFEHDFSDAPKVGPLAMTAKAKMLKKGTWGAEAFDELEPEEDAPVIWKTRNSGFYGTNLDLVLKDMKNLIFTGFDTIFCVESTIRDALDREFNVIILKDCCFSSNPKGAEFSLKNILRPLITIVTSEDMIKADFPKGNLIHLR